MKPFEKYLTATELARTLGFSPQTIKRWRIKKLITPIRRGNMWFYDKEDVMRMFDTLMDKVNNE